jgi:rhodanese-related sulfurtransferase
MKDFFGRESIRIAVILLLGLGGLFGLIYSKKQALKLSTATVPVEATPAMNAESVTAAPVRTPMPTPVPTQTKDVADTSGCRVPGANRAADSGRMEVTQSSLADLKKGKETLVVLNTASGDCFRKGDIYSVNLVFRGGEPTVTTYRDLNISKARIKRLVAMPMHDLSWALENHVQIDELDQAIEAIEAAKAAPANGKETLLYIAAITLEGKVKFHSGVIPETHPMAPNIGKKEVLDLQRQGAAVIDTRAEDKFAFKTIPGARNIALGNYDGFQFSLIRIRTHLDLIQSLGPRMPSDKKTQVIVFSRNDREMVSYNAISAFAFLGYRNLHWYRKGFEDWLDADYPTPLQAPGMDTITSEDLGRLIQNRAVVIDVRKPVEYSGFHIQSAISAPFNSARDLSDVTLYRPPKPVIAEMKKLKEGFANSDLQKIPRRSTIVVVGVDDHDWGAFKAAAFLSELHYTVKWYRKGILDFYQAQADQPEKFKSEPPPNLIN